MLMMGTAEAGYRLAAHCGNASATGGERGAPAALVVADDDGRLPVVLLLGARRSAGERDGDVFREDDGDSMGVWVWHREYSFAHA
jgi:hypothetical protein